MNSTLSTEPGKRCSKEQRDSLGVNFIKDTVSSGTTSISDSLQSCFIQETEINCKKHGKQKRRYFSFRPQDSDLCSKCIQENSKGEKSEWDIELDNNKIERKIKTGRIQERYKEARLKDLINSFPKDSKELKMIGDLFRNIRAGVKEPKSFILSGDIGTGKTHAGSALINEINISTEKRGVYCKIDDIISNYNKKGHQCTDEYLVGRCLTSSLLVIDEVIPSSSSDKSAEYYSNILFRIIDERYQNFLPTVLITNLQLKDLINFISQRTADRIISDKSQFIAMTGHSKRMAK